MEVFILPRTRFESWLPLGTLTEVVVFLISISNRFLLRRIQISHGSVSKTLRAYHCSIILVASVGIGRVEMEVKRKAVMVSPRVGAEFVQARLEGNYVQVHWTATEHYSCLTNIMHVWFPSPCNAASGLTFSAYNVQWSSFGPACATLAI
jgi:hypothetical protein